VDVDRLTAFLGELNRHLEGKAVGRGECERLLARDDLLARELVEELRAPLERLTKAFLFGADDPLDLPGMLDHLRVPGPYLFDDDRRQPVDGVEPDAPRLHDGTADQASQEVPAPLVSRRDALGHEERHAAAVVGEDAMGLRRLDRGAVADARLAL